MNSLQIIYPQEVIKKGSKLNIPKLENIKNVSEAFISRWRKCTFKKQDIKVPIKNDANSAHARACACGQENIGRKYTPILAGL